MPVLLTFLSGCAGLTQRGEVTTQHFNLPDGKVLKTWERTKLNIFVPSYIERKAFVASAQNKQSFSEVDLTKSLNQKGVGNDVVVELIRAGTVVGSTVYAANKAVDAAKAIGEGLSNSGDTLNVSNDTSNSANNKAKAGAGALSFASAKAKSKSKSTAGIKAKFNNNVSNTNTNSLKSSLSSSNKIENKPNNHLHNYNSSYNSNGRGIPR